MIGPASRTTECPGDRAERKAKSMGRLVARMGTRMQEVKERATSVLRSDQGDVPGWVLITLMTAGLQVITDIAL